MTHDTRGSGARGTPRNAVPALELGLKKGGGAELFVAGRSTARLDRRLGANALGLSPVETVIFVAAAAFAVYLVISLDDLGEAVPKI